MRPIDADGLTETLAIVAKKMAKSDAQKALIGRVLYIIDHKPTVDALPVVRCNGCEWLGTRHQKCTCCIRNVSNMKDLYKRKDGD